MTLREDLNRGNAQIGVFLSIPSPELAEMLGHAGFDFILVDVEHGTFSARDFADVARGASAAGTASLARLSSASGQATAMLDAGADGVQLTGVPASKVACTVGELLYPPQGTRGFSGYTRAGRYGLADRKTLLGRAPLLGVQVEFPETLERLDELCAAPGLDLVFFGPVDFAISSSRLPEARRTPVEQARRAVFDAATAHGKIAGCHARTLEEVAMLIDEGFRYVTVGFMNLTATYWRDNVRGLHAALERAHG